MHNFGHTKYWAVAVGVISLLLLMFSRNSDFWTVLAGLLTLASLAFGIYSYLIERTRSQKKVTVSLVSLSKLINTAARVDGRPLIVFFGKEAVTNFAISRIEIVNSGGTEIVASDFERNLAVIYNNVDKIYYAEVRGQSSPSLRPFITVQDRQVLIEPLLLNPRDSFVIEAGIDLAQQNADLQISALGRIAGVSEIEVSAADRGKSRDAPALLSTEGAASGQLLGAVGFGLIGGIALAGVLAIWVFNSFPIEVDPARSSTAHKIIEKPVN